MNGDNTMLNGLKNITNNELVKDNLIFYSMYLLYFETKKNSIVDDLYYFLNDFSIKNGKVNFQISKEYKKLQDKKFNGKKNIFLATMDWFVNNNAITKDEFEKIKDIRNDRNMIGHELFSLIYKGTSENMENNFIEMVKIFSKIDKWWILNIEIPTSVDPVDIKDIDTDGVISGTSLMLDILIENIYGNNAYKELIGNIKKELF